jgi:hypothetical protein
MRRTHVTYHYVEVMVKAVVQTWEDTSYYENHDPDLRLQLCRFKVTIEQRGQNPHNHRDGQNHTRPSSDIGQYETSYSSSGIRQHRADKL